MPHNLVSDSDWIQYRVAFGIRKLWSVEMLKNTGLATWHSAFVATAVISSTVVSPAIYGDVRLCWFCKVSSLWSSRACNRTTRRNTHLQCKAIYRVCLKDSEVRQQNGRIFPRQRSAFYKWLKSMVRQQSPACWFYNSVLMGNLKKKKELSRLSSKLNIRVYHQWKDSPLTWIIKNWLNN